MPETAETDLTFCVAALPKVSRTFALCIRLLPPELERSVMVAYLLCRIADTIEDTADLQVEQKKTLLHRFAASIAAPQDDITYLREAFPESDDAEANLCFHADRVLREFARLSQAEQAAIRPWVEEMCRGMAEFCREVVHVNGGQLPTLKDVEELDQYCYYVAGTVGHLLTGLFGLRLSARGRSRIPELESYSTSFGLGLQLTNIIKDAAQDHRRGWSFIPQDLCAEEGIDVASLFSKGHTEASQRVFAGLITKARGHLDDALHYSMVLPATQYRIRLFCLTSLFFAVRTLRLAASDDGRLADGVTVKISRAEVYRILATTCVVASSNRLVRWYFRRLGRPARS